MATNGGKNWVQWQTGPIRITISVGIAQSKAGAEDSICKPIDHADKTLYRAKEARRNRVEVQNGA
ncbi:MAG: GGDEF domain-containing protein [Deltaproteobacteria bacterium]|nr:GGDEF domain-containing protein [Deltaproteobacteria bacterium]